MGAWRESKKNPEEVLGNPKAVRRPSKGSPKRFCQKQGGAVQVQSKSTQIEFMGFQFDSSFFPKRHQVD